ncbi:coiled-coil domain-containing protein [Amycolatopsis sp. CA-126428]|uniref:coiled-coil domain-containing protein n=1 Tax=Amycolatopsis sp. CA-126428 TaxID=2073158 RepID=UPI001E56B063|nr:hypothetical protein [Amycolatopsis sp. CA-126428]
MTTDPLSQSVLCRLAQRNQARGFRHSRGDLGDSRGHRRPADGHRRPSPFRQVPPSGSEALAKYRELAAQAGKLNEDLLKARSDQDARQRELDKATGDLDAAKDQGAKPSENQKKYQAEVDKFAGASFTGGVQLNKLSALLSGPSAQDFLDRSSALEVLATEKNGAMTDLTGAVQQADAAAAKAADAVKRAQDARDAAAKLTEDIKAKQKTLDDQIEQIKAADKTLSAGDRAGRYGGAMTTRLAGVKQVILLFALAWCVVAMHHVGMSDGASVSPMNSMSAAQLDTGPAAAPGDEHPDMPSDAHGLLHLCLAVLSAAGAALLALLALWSFSRSAALSAATTGSPRSARPERPPDRLGRTVLTSLCVLRV